MTETFKKFATYHRLFGSLGLWLAVRSRLSRGSPEITATPRGFTHPVHLRLKGTEVATLKKIVLDAEYDLQVSQEPKVIIDAGANVGFASIFFARKYPNARILALEPERSNFALLEKNVRPYPNVLPVFGALWKENTKINLVDPGIGPWGFQTQSIRPGAGDRICEQVEAMTMDALMLRHGLKYIDILKVDIEGSEKEVFENASAWIGNVGVIMIELHDRMRTGCSRSVYVATRDFEFETCKGENVFFARKAYAPAAQRS